MEPNISPDLHGVDLTLALLEDLGWQSAGTVPTASVPAASGIWLWLSAATLAGVALLVLRRRPA